MRDLASILLGVIVVSALIYVVLSGALTSMNVKPIITIPLWKVINNALMPVRNYSTVLIPVNLTVRWNTSTYMLRAEIIQSGDIVFRNGFRLRECGPRCLELVKNGTGVRILINIVQDTCIVTVCNVPVTVATCVNESCTVTHVYPRNTCVKYTSLNATYVAIFNGGIIFSLGKCG